MREAKGSTVSAYMCVGGEEYIIIAAIFFNIFHVIRTMMTAEEKEFSHRKAIHDLCISIS